MHFNEESQLTSKRRRPQKEQLLIEGQGVAVGHAGDEIAGPFFGRVADGIILEIAGRMGQDVSIEVGQDLPRFGVLHLGLVAQIDPIIEEIPKLDGGGHDAGAHGDPLQFGPEAGHDHVHDHGVDAKGVIPPQLFDQAGGDVAVLDDTGPRRVVEVVIDVGDDVGNTDQLPLQSQGHVARLGVQDLTPAFGVLQDPVPDLQGQVQALALVLELIHYPQALLGMAEPSRQKFAQRLLPRMAEGRMAQVMSQGDRFGQVLVKPQGPGNGPGNLRHLQGVGQPRPIVVPEGSQEHLGLMLQTAERFAVKDAVAIPLESRAQRMVGFPPGPAFGVEAETGFGREDLLLELFDALTDFHARSHRVNTFNGPKCQIFANDTFGFGLDIAALPEVYLQRDQGGRYIARRGYSSSRGKRIIL